MVRPPSRLPLDMRLPEEIVPYAAKLNGAMAPSQLIMAAQALAEGRYGSSDPVKLVSVIINGIRYRSQ